MIPTNLQTSQTLVKVSLSEKLNRKNSMPFCKKMLWIYLKSSHVVLELKSRFKKYEFFRHIKTVYECINMSLIK